MKKLLKKVFSIETQLKIEKFFVEELWQLCLVTAFIFICAWVFNKYTEAINQENTQWKNFTLLL